MATESSKHRVYDSIDDAFIHSYIRLIKADKTQLCT